MASMLPQEDLDHICTRCEALWPYFADAHIFVTGATGFFGKWFLDALFHASRRHHLGLRITALTRNPAAFLKVMPHLAEETALSWHSGDVRDFSFPAGRFTHIIHAAATASAKLNTEQPLEMFDTIVSGTRRTLDFANASGAKDFLLISSGAIYGSQPPELSHIREDFQGAPSTTDSEAAYAEGKRVAELLCCMYAKSYSLAPRIARCFAFLGPHLPLDAHFAAGNFLRDAHAGKKIILTGNGTPYRSYMHPADLVIWLLNILIHGKNNQPYNVGSNEPVRLLDLAHMISRLSAAKPDVLVKGPRDDRPAARYVPSTDLAQDALGLELTIPLEECIARTFKWLSNNTP